MKKTQLVKWGAICCLVAAGSAKAAVPDDSSAPVIHAGGVDIYPGIGLEEKHSSNLYRSDVNKKSSAITILSPSVLLEAKRGANVYSVNYSADLAQYAQSSVDNYNDQNLAAAAELSLSTRASLKIAPQYQIGHDDRGSTYSIMTPVPNVWHKTGVGGEFSYGSTESIGRIVVGLSSNDVRYQNNRDVTVAFDKNLNDVTGTFYYRVSPKVFSFIQLDNLRIKYLNAATTLSSTEQRAMVGATWKATAQTSGSFKIGQLEKKFDSALRPTFRGTSWEGNLRWSPREFVRLDWGGARTLTESTGVGNFLQTTSNTLDLGYDVSGRTGLHLTASRLTEDFAQTARSDVTPSYGLSMDYKLRSWLILDAGYTTSTKTSTGYTGTNPNYHSKIFSVGIHTAF